MEKQKELAELLWAMDNTKKSYQKLIAATDELVKSKFAALSCSNLNLWSCSAIQKLTRKDFRF